MVSRQPSNKVLDFNGADHFNGAYHGMHSTESPWNIRHYYKSARGEMLAAADQTPKVSLYAMGASKKRLSNGALKNDACEEIKSYIGSLAFWDSLPRIQKLIQKMFVESDVESLKTVLTYRRNKSETLPYPRTKLPMGLDGDLIKLMAQAWSMEKILETACSVDDADGIGWLVDSGVATWQDVGDAASRKRNGS
jgi:hypothetical protein